MAAEFVERLGARMREQREALGLSMAEVARRMPGKVSENQVYRWELGKHQPKPDTLEALAKVLDTTVAALMAPAPKVEETPEPFGPTVADLDKRLAHIEAQLEQLLGRRPPTDLDEQTAEEALDYLKRATQVMQDTLGRLGRDVGRQDLEASPSADRSRSRSQVAA